MLKVSVQIVGGGTDPLAIPVTSLAFQCDVSSMECIPKKAVNVKYSSTLFGVYGRGGQHCWNLARKADKILTMLASYEKSR